MQDGNRPQPIRRGFFGAVRGFISRIYNTMRGRPETGVEMTDQPAEQPAVPDNFIQRIGRVFGMFRNFIRDRVIAPVLNRFRGTEPGAPKPLEDRGAGRADAKKNEVTIRGKAISDPNGMDKARIQKYEELLKRCTERIEVKDRERALNEAVKFINEANAHGLPYIAIQFLQNADYNTPTNISDVRLQLLGDEMLELLSKAPKYQEFFLGSLEERAEFQPTELAKNLRTFFSRLDNGGRELVIEFFNDIAEKAAQKAAFPTIRFEDMPKVINGNKSTYNFEFIQLLVRLKSAEQNKANETYKILMPYFLCIQGLTIDQDNLEAAATILNIIGLDSTGKPQTFTYKELVELKKRFFVNAEGYGTKVTIAGDFPSLAKLINENEKFKEFLIGAEDRVGLIEKILKLRDEEMVNFPELTQIYSKFSSTKLANIKDLNIFLSKDNFEKIKIISENDELRALCKSMMYNEYHNGSEITGLLRLTAYDLKALSEAFKKESKDMQSEIIEFMSSKSGDNPYLYRLFIKVQQLKGDSTKLEEDGKKRLEFYKFIIKHNSAQVANYLIGLDTNAFTNVFNNINTYRGNTYDDSNKILLVVQLIVAAEDSKGIHGALAALINKGMSIDSFGDKRQYVNSKFIQYLTKKIREGGGVDKLKNMLLNPPFDFEKLDKAHAYKDKPSGVPEAFWQLYMAKDPEAVLERLLKEVAKEPEQTPKASEQEVAEAAAPIKEEEPGGRSKEGAEAQGAQKSMDHQEVQDTQQSRVQRSRSGSVVKQKS
ncbi:hypothetical protein Cyrtocomes_01016 [Candidatus Cyrtobacter comes]|uniref:Uncharacterized protein n=1 Tax=Candidatus Cyrtobacter comes TaxID=675776 RepID=A0ABU5L9R5_9RICK|nr:hypothetical protein [Candidatus Cyrtobacter comes]MDZ5762625.1 hypothetical protein [Candidatus Cyrtobacter comes]